MLVYFLLKTLMKTNRAGWTIPPFSIGKRSSFMVDFPGSHVGFSESVKWKKSRSDFQPGQVFKVSKVEKP